ncbi:ABC transporter ATP-binding protein [Longispora sp. K20-0274]|uniref:ABC transporter ATP-binding protein n=1 Tax=Longispora sp. K20-0274 TaxID=3088255 RepID=UPI003999774E
MTGRRIGLSPAEVASRIAHAVGLTLRAAPGSLAGYVAGTLLAAALPVATAWLTRSVVDGLVGGVTAQWTAQVVALAVVGLFAAAVPAALRYLHNEMERAVALVAKERLFTAVDRIIGLARFEDPAFLDRLELADESGGRGPNRVVDGAFGVLGGLLTVSGFLGSLWVVSPVMAVVVLASGLPVLAAELVLSRQRAWTNWEITPAERRELFYRDMLATEQAAKEVRLFGLGAFLRGRMLLERRGANAAQHRMDRRELATQAGLGLFSAVVAGAGLIWVARAAQGGQHTVGDIALFIAGIVGVQGAMAAVAQQVATAHQALLLFEHYVSVLRAAPDLPVAENPAELPALRSGIEFRDVWFRYTENHPWVLRGVNLTIPHGHTVALAGLNGAGKSTVVKLLCRLYDPTRGAVLWDGVDLREVEPAALRTRISAVFQDYVNYEMTAAENIGVGDLGALDDRARIEAAADRAGVHEALAGLPHGYDTMLSRRFHNDPSTAAPQAGVNPSGGQRQRIAIARAFLRENRDLVILDEPSAGLDAEAEHEIHTRLRDQRAGLTSLLISHRLGAVRDAGLIVVLSDGVVAEQGDHDALVAAGGVYARLFGLQAAGYQNQGV